MREPALKDHEIMKETPQHLQQAGDDAAFDLFEGL